MNVFFLVVRRSCSETVFLLFLLGGSPQNPDREKERRRVRHMTLCFVVLLFSVGKEVGHVLNFSSRPEEGDFFPKLVD